MKAWVGRALELLAASLEPPCHELNELDWKAALSSDKRRLVEHLSAFANHPGGGFMVYGVDASGTPGGLDAAAIEATIHQLANLGRQGLEPPLSLDHAVADYESKRGRFDEQAQRTLLVWVRHPVRPVFLINRSFPNGEYDVI